MQDTVGLGQFANGPLSVMSASRLCVKFADVLAPECPAEKDCSDCRNKNYTSAHLEWLRRRVTGLSGSKYQFSWAARKCGLLPLAERPAQQGCRAAFPTEDNHVLPESKAGVPGNESKVAGCMGCEDPVIAGFLLDSANTCKQRGRCHC